MSLNRKRILIAGGTGFIGRNLVEFFMQKGDYEVHCTNFQRAAYLAPGVIFHQVDLRNPEQVNKLFSNNFDILIQAAATTSGAKDIVNSPSLHVTDNAVMNSYIMKSAVEHKVKHIVFFSCTVMYPNADFPQAEDSFKAEEIYPKYFGVGWTKIYIEKICEFFSRVGQTKFTVLRHSNIYGSYDKYDLEKSHVFGATVTKVMTADKEVLVWGDGSETRDLLHVSDLMSFVDACLTKQKTSFELVNVGLGQNCSIKDLVQKIVKQSGKNLNVVYDTSKPTIPTHVQLDISKAQKLFGWNPKISLDEGIKATLNWYAENVK